LDGIWGRKVVGIVVVNGVKVGVVDVGVDVVDVGVVDVGVGVVNVGVSVVDVGVDVGVGVVDVGVGVVKVDVVIFPNVVDVMLGSVRKKAVVVIAVACTCMFVKVSIKGSGHDAASVCTSLFPSSPLLPLLITLPMSLPLHLLVGVLGPVVACGCSLSPLMMQVPRHCILLSASHMSVLPLSMVRTRGVQGISESRSWEWRCTLEVLVVGLFQRWDYRLCHTHKNQ